MHFMQRLLELAKDGATPDSDVPALRRFVAGDRHRGRAIMRQILIAAAIAAGLLALWAALLPIAA